MNLNHDVIFGYTWVPEYNMNIIGLPSHEIKIDDPDHNTMVVEEHLRKWREYFKSVGSKHQVFYNKSNDSQPNVWVVNEDAIPL